MSSQPQTHQATEDNQFATGSSKATHSRQNSQIEQAMNQSQVVQSSSGGINGQKLNLRSTLLTQNPLKPQQIVKVNYQPSKASGNQLNLRLSDQDAYKMVMNDELGPRRGQDLYPNKDLQAGYAKPEIHKFF